MATKKIEHTAPKGAALTLDELAAFVTDARKSGATGGEVVTVRATWGSKIQRLSVDVDVAAADAATTTRLRDLDKH